MGSETSDQVVTLLKELTVLKEQNREYEGDSSESRTGGASTLPTASRGDNRRNQEFRGRKKDAVSI